MSIIVLPGGHCMLCHKDFDCKGEVHHGLPDYSTRPATKRVPECTNPIGTATPCLITCNPKWSYSKYIGKPLGRILKVDGPEIDVLIELDGIEKVVKMPLIDVIIHMIRTNPF